MSVQIQLRRGTNAQWVSTNPILAQGELAVELDTEKFKIGNGINRWVDLAYASGPQGLKGDTGIQGPAGINGTIGIDGLSAYNIAVVNGYSGSEVSWINSLKGDTGVVDPSLLTAETEARIAADLLLAPISTTYTKTAVDTALATKANVTASASAPANPVVGDLWWVTDDGSLYVYYYDGSSYQWVIAAPIEKTGVIDVNSPLTYDMATSTIGTDGTLGYINIPQNSQGSSNYTLVIGDAGKHIYHPTTDVTTRTWTIPANSAVPFIIGTSIMMINDSVEGAITINITTDTLIKAGTGLITSATLAGNGIAKLIKISSSRWFIDGTGLT